MAKWLFEHNDVETWHTSDKFETREEAIKEGREFFAGEEVGFTFSIGQQEPAINLVSVNAFSVIDNAQESMYEEVGEIAESWLENVSADARERLEERMNAVFKEWLVQEGLEPRFNKIINIEEVPLEVAESGQEG